MNAEGGNGTETMRDIKFRVPGDLVNRATADLPDFERSMIRGFHAYAVEHRYEYGLPELAAKVRYDESTLHRVFHNKYEGNLANVCKEIDAFLKLESERAKGKKMPYVETALSRRIWKLCDAALEFQRIVWIFGDTQTGKTTALLVYRDRHNHGSTIYVRVPTGGSLTLTLGALAEALRISPQQKEKELRRRVKEAFDDRMLLIVDEAHQCVVGGGDLMRPTRTLEFVREIHDETSCGVVICGTNVLKEKIENHGPISGILMQCRRRRLAALQLPNTPSQADLNLFAAAYSLPPATGAFHELETRVIRDEALGMWLTLLRMGAKVAAKAGKTMTWEHVKKAYDGLQALEAGKL